MNSILSKLLGTASRPAVDVGLHEMDVQKTKAASSPNVLRKLGKKGQKYRRLINYFRTGPFVRQVGSKWVAGEEWPLLHTFYVHHWLHATKGWRTYSGGAGMRLPNALAPGAHPAMAMAAR